MELRNSHIFKIFVASPGDVANLRTQAFDLIHKLSEDSWRPDGLIVEGYGWDVTHYPKLADRPPQVNIRDGLPDMGEYDLCLFIIGSRLGTPLDGENFEALPDGRQPTGTEYEYRQAVECKDGPRVLVYHHKQPLSIASDLSPEEQQALLSQYQLARQFIAGVSKDEVGHFVGDPFTFETSAVFEERLEKDLKHLVNERLSPAKGVRPKQSEPAAADKLPPAYLRWLQRQLPELNLKGMKLKTAYSARLPDIYVPALIQDRHMGTGGFMQAATGERSGLTLLLSHVDKASLYLSGAPGSGKTTFSLWLCWIICQGAVPVHAISPPEAYQESLPQDLAGRLPILCRLRDFWGHMDCQRDNGSWTRHQLEQALAGWLDTKQPDGLRGNDFLQWLQAGRCLLILDGFDEVPARYETAAGPSYPRDALLSGLAASIEAWGELGNRILLTSRPYGLNQAEVHSLRLEESPLQALPRTLQALFISRWYAASQGAKGGEIAQALLKHLGERKEAWLDELTRNPLLLTALCVKFGESKLLPTDIHELFDAVVENTLYNRYRNQAGELLPVRRRLEAIAWGMQTGEELGMQATCPVAEIGLEQVDRLLARRAELNPMSEAGVLTAAQRREELLNRTGLLIPHGEAAAGFYHLMFQDFFAAEYALHDEGLWLADLLEAHADDPRWHAMLIFLFSGLLRRGTGVDGPVRRFGFVLRSHLNAEALAHDPLPAILWGQCLELVNTQVDSLGELGDEFYNACLEALRQVENPQHRLRLFDSLARLGLDRRKGVGLRPDGRPDIDWVEIPAGEFIYGEGEEQTKIRLEGFYISRYPITNAQFQAFIDAGGYEMEDWWWDIRHMQPAESGWKLANRPREKVSWHEAVAFCRWLSRELGFGIRLPSEREWERAARGTEGREYPWGDGYRAGAANVSEQPIEAGPNFLAQTTAVGLYLLGGSPEGVMDMAGNLWEWCLNTYDAPTFKDPDNSIDRLEMRGGSWYDYPEDARSPGRDWTYSVSRYSDLGFRILCSGPLMDH